MATIQASEDTALAFGIDTAPPPLEVGDEGVSINFDGSESTSSSTQSLSSSIQEHVYANGKYLLPSDEAEQDRLDLFHHCKLVELGGDLCKARFDGDPARVLDIGTGTGIWALDFGETHPGSEVIGVDLMPIQPSWTYSNVRFETDDMEKDWTYKPEFFDYVHARHINSGIKDWPRMIQQAYGHLASGGRFEISEHNYDQMYCDDGTLTDDSILNKYTKLYGKTLTNSGVRSDLHGRDYKRMLEEAGFVDVKVYTYKTPWGKWPKDKTAKKVGEYTAESLKTGLEAYGMMLLTRVAGMGEGEAKRWFDGVLREVGEGKVHAYSWQWQIVGRKP